MIQDTLAKIEAKIQGAATIPDERREELLRLVTTLKDEVGQLEQTHGEDAQSIAAFTQASTHEATRTERNPRLMEHSLEGLAASVAGLEKSHPRLFQSVQSICNTLSNLGI